MKGREQYEYEIHTRSQRWRYDIFASNGQLNPMYLSLCVDEKINVRVGGYDLPDSCLCLEYIYFSFLTNRAKGSIFIFHQPRLFLTRQALQYTKNYGLFFISHAVSGPPGSRHLSPWLHSLF